MAAAARPRPAGRTGGGRQDAEATGDPSLGGQAQPRPRAGRGEHLPATGRRAASGQVRASAGVRASPALGFLGGRLAVRGE